MPRRAGRNRPKIASSAADGRTNPGLTDLADRDDGDATALAGMARFRELLLQPVKVVRVDALGQCVRQPQTERALYVGHTFDLRRCLSSARLRTQEVRPRARREALGRTSRFLLRVASAVAVSAVSAAASKVASASARAAAISASASRITCSQRSRACRHVVSARAAAAETAYSYPTAALSTSLVRVTRCSSARCRTRSVPLAATEPGAPAGELVPLGPLLGAPGPDAGDVCARPLLAVVLARPPEIRLELG